MNTVVTDPRKARQFHFCGCDYDPASGQARLVYRFDQGPELVESFRFPDAPWPEDSDRQAAFGSALKILHRIAGVSYYKAGLSRKIVFDDESPDPGMAGFLQKLYQEGLAEFAYVNQVKLADRIHFESSGAPPENHALELPNRALVAMGGGKDSLVGLEMLRSAGVDIQPVCVGGSSLIGATVKRAGLPLLRIERKLAPELAELSRKGGWNGHVPITAINSAVLLCASILYGYRYIVFSNERSADEATLSTGDGTQVNHQFSKSSVFEHMFRQLIDSQVSPDIEYFSILRPFSELEIVRRFSHLETFHDVYSSCNRNFHIDGSRIDGRWCLDCPKCRFAALSLALFMTPAQVSRIMGGDLLDQESQADGFRALCSLGRDKPFECVGEAGESRAVLAALALDSPWRNHAVVGELAPELEQVEIPQMEALLTPSVHHYIPNELRSVLE